MGPQDLRWQKDIQDSSDRSLLKQTQASLVPQIVPWQEDMSVPM